MLRNPCLRAVQKKTTIYEYETNKWRFHYKTHGPRVLLESGFNVFSSVQTKSRFFFFFLCTGHSKARNRAEPRTDGGNADWNSNSFRHVSRAHRRWRSRRRRCVRASNESFAESYARGDDGEATEKKTVRRVTAGGGRRERKIDRRGENNESRSGDVVVVVVVVIKCASHNPLGVLNNRSATQKRLDASAKGKMGERKNL